jgi:NitT/TauT family transport system permease protein
MRTPSTDAVIDVGSVAPVPAHEALSQPRRRPRWRAAGHLATIALPIALSLFVLVAWEFVVRFAKVPAAILPPPSAIFEQLATHYALLLKHAVPTTLETLLAFGLSIPLGVFIAAVMTWSPVINKAVYPNVIFFQLIPKIALAPLFIVWLGIGLPSRTTFSIFISFFPILVATAAGLQSVPRDMLRLCRSVGASDWQVLVHVRFPTALPFLFSGMKVAVTLSIIGIVVGEFIASQQGLGYLILFASSRLQTDLSLACIAVLCAVGLGLYGLVVLSERAAMRWYGDR